MKIGKFLIAPLLLVITGLAGFFTLERVSEYNPRYSIDQVAETARVTAYDIRYGWGARTGDNSSYTLGELDGSFASLVRLAPAAINVSLFRPYLWEVKNPLMLMSALESFLILILTIRQLFSFKNAIKALSSSSLTIFCFSFSILFAFAVGVSTFNFGTLARYKIPLLPFYLSGLVLLEANKSKKR